MNIGHRVLCLIIELSLMYTAKSEDIQDSENTISDDLFRGKEPNGYLQDIEIVKMYMTARNSLKIFWGITPEDIKLNRTYGLFHDIDNKENLTASAFFVDDGKIYNFPLNGNTLQEDLDNLSRWCSVWLLPLNIEKCAVHHIEKNNPRKQYFIDGVQIVTTEQTSEPKTTTQDPCIEVLNLEYCKRYFFAVAPLNNGTGINPNSTNIRSILTYMDPKAPPRDLHVDFLPGYSPCLLIKWTASCRNIPDPQGYEIRLIDNPPGMTETQRTHKTPPSIAFQQACTLPVRYGEVVEISIANDIPGASFSRPAKFKVPQFMQPFDVRLAVNESSKAFLLYWREPYVPVCDGRFFYEVFVYEERNVTENSNYTVFRVTRPGFVFKGNGSEYTFGVDVACCDFSRRSAVSDLVYGNVRGEIEHFVQF